MISVKKIEKKIQEVLTNTQDVNMSNKLKAEVITSELLKLITEENNTSFTTESKHDQN